MAEVLTGWIFIPVRSSITISREIRQSIICQIWNCFSMISCMESSMLMKNGAPITEGHMVMGVKDAEIKDVVTQLNGDYSIYGANFTKQSKVYINDEKQDTKFMNNTRLDLKDSELKDGDTIMVAQVGSSNTIFRTSKTYEYKDGKLSEIVETDDSVENGRQAFTDQEEKKD